ncbi:flagellar P-ring protein precursor FlgI [Mariprofundus ferrinatatus]|uniref:Flagellar P-ring protein n=2 Tax=Mariprofundus ferrinatatus TaxID=1921087 RepID=A0A2K8L6P0_9PROT|nr:flagellar basal body P-ring protein FlgI [Mariprofundus ferrinatatus]ATX82947.1 flagellar P-ring protein precursor FlgI [Mariprofundus ferrinatatus]
MHRDHNDQATIAEAGGKLTTALFMITALLVGFLASSTAYAERIKDLATVQGVRSNELIGYGLVVGLNGTGDSSNSSPYTISSINAMLERFGINVRSKIATMKPKNIAAVMITATLPPFARPGQKLDVTVSSMGDSKSLRGGTLLLTPLLAGNNQVYAVAQGALSVGGFTAGGNASSKTVGHPTVGRIPNGANIERAAPTTMHSGQEKITLQLNNPDFSTIKRMRDAINSNFGTDMARTIDAGTIEVWNPEADAIELIARLEQIELTTDHHAIVVMDERTGTIVMGQEVRIDTVAVAHGTISVSVTESPQVSQPNAFAGGETQTVDRTDVQVDEEEAQLVVLPRQVSLSTLVAALNAVGATPSDLIAVLQAIKAAGALHAELRVI